MRIRTTSPLNAEHFDSNMNVVAVATTSVFDTMTPEEEEEAFQRLRSLSKRFSSSIGSSGSRRSSLADVVCEVAMVKDSFFRKFVNSTLSLVATMRKEEKRSVKELFYDVVGFLGCWIPFLREPKFE